MRNLLSVIFLLMATTAIAAPFLVCDPQDGVETYEVFQDGVLVSGDVPAQSDGSLKYDLQGITPGAYAFTVKACEGLWGCSALSDPFVSRNPVSKPTDLRMIK